MAGASGVITVTVADEEGKTAVLQVCVYDVFCSESRGKRARAWGG